MQPDNTITIGSWISDSRDTELEALAEELEKLAEVEDVRTVVPEIARRLQERRERKEKERYCKDGVYKTIANSVPSSPKTHARKRFPTPNSASSELINLVPSS